MDGRSFEAGVELSAVKLVADSVLAQDAQQVATVGRQKRQNSDKKVTIEFLFI